MAHRSSTVYRIAPNDTLASIASSFELSSWRAIAQAPENQSLLLSVAAATELTRGTVIKVPPSARALLIERVFALQRLRPLLKNHFQVLEDLFTNDVLPLEIIARLDDERVVTSMLAGLEGQVKRDIDLAHQSARSISEINAALALTHLHNEGDLAFYAGGNLQYVGLNWAVTPQLLEAWHGMWSSSFWVSRWKGTSSEEAKRAIAIHLNLIRSKIMQQTDQRINESYRLIRSLDNEKSVQ